MSYSGLLKLICRANWTEIDTQHFVRNEHIFVKEGWSNIHMWHKSQVLWTQPQWQWISNLCSNCAREKLEVNHNLSSYELFFSIKAQSNHLGSRGGVGGANVVILHDRILF